MKLIDLTGAKFGRLTVISVADKTSSRKYRWNCICECGVEVIVFGTNLRTGKTQSCGCLRDEVVKVASVTHGKRYTPEYSVWCGMKARCYDEKNEKFYTYGARGVVLSEEWVNNFQKFYDDMGPRPGKGFTIERVDVNLGYSKENCIWVKDGSMQAFNQTKKVNNTSGRTNVYWRENRQHWFVAIYKNGKRYGFGSYKNFDDAVKAAEFAELEVYGVNRSFYLEDKADGVEL